MTVDHYRAISAFLREKQLDNVVVFITSVHSGLFYIAMPLLLVYQYNFSGNPWLKTAVYAAIPFLLVSMFRKLLNKPRPYDALDFDPIIRKSSHGCSFPSRHVFSAFLIAMLWLSECCVFGILLLICSFSLALLRVIGGVHYPSDVIAGCILGVLSGLIYIFAG